MKRRHFNGGLVWRHGPQMRSRIDVARGVMVCGRVPDWAHATTDVAEVTCRHCLRCLRLAAITVAYDERAAEEERTRCREFEEALGA